MDSQRDVLNLGFEATDIPSLITQLKDALLRLVSWDWEREFRRNDLAQQVHKLEEQLRNVMPYSDWADHPSPPPPTPDTANYQQQIEALAKDVAELQRGKQELEAQVESLKSQNWELGYDRRDLREQVGKLTMHLRGSVCWTDADAYDASMTLSYNTQPRTTMEKILEERVHRLEDEVKELRRTTEQGSGNPASGTRR